MAAAWRPRGWRARASASPCWSAGASSSPASFPSRFPDLRGEMQLTGKRMRVGLADRPLRRALRRGHARAGRLRAGRRLADQCRRGAAARSRACSAIPSGRTRSRRTGCSRKATPGRRAGCGRRAIPAAAERSKYKALQRASAALGKAPVAAPVVVSFEATVNPAGVAQPACTHCGDCCGGCNVGAKNTVALTYLPDAARHGAEIFTHAKVRHVAKAPDGRLAASTSSGRTERATHRRRDGRHGGAGGRHAGLHRDPAALARARACACPDRLGQQLLGQRRHHRLRLRRQAAGQRHRRRPPGQGRRARRRAPASRARSRSSTSTTWPRA